MYLKQIDMFGFKSFAKKMVFEFDQGITAIVGPNGSGKSNISDAIRWVLGEQSAKQLRGSRMQDVIFAGTENRKALGYCQVDLTIDNSDLKMPIDYTEVTVSRRVYRSGESEFYINGTVCRLKDIHEFFLDTGVGKEGYSIIGQGQIDKILSTKPDDRRALFDEAAGIVKYKVRKKSAEKKLEEEKQNLLRINDIIRELEERQDVLEEQSEVAKEYLGYKEDLKKYEINIFITETDRLQDDIGKYVDKENIVNDNMKKITAEIDEIKNEHTEVNEKIGLLEREAEQEKNKATEVAIQKEKNENAVELNKVEIQNLQKDNQRLVDEIENIVEKEKSSEVNKSSYLSKLEEYENAYEENKEELIGVKAELEGITAEILNDETEIENIKTNIIERLNELSGVKSKIQRKQAMLENFAQRQSVVDSRKVILENTIDTLKDDVKSETALLDQYILDKKQLKADKGSISLQLKELSARIDNENKNYHTHRITMTNLQSKLKALNDLTSHYEGYNISIKRIMEYKAKQHIEGVVGVVADIINVDKDYELAIETALGGSIQNIITKDENVAKEMIGYLKSNKFGRATFLPLSTIRPRNFNQKNLANEVGFIGYGNELVKTDSAYQKIIDSLLQNVIIVDHIDHAITIARKYNYTLRIVTVAGEIINPGGSLTGGAYRNKGQQFLSRKREISTYEENVKKIQKEMTALDQFLTSLKDEKFNLEKDNDEVIRKENDLNIEINAKTIQLKQLETEMNRNSRDIEDLTAELTAIASQKVELTKEVEVLNESLDDTEGLNQEAEEMVKSKNDSVLSLKEQSSLMTEQVTDLQVILSSLKQQIENQKENAVRLENESKEFVSLKEKYSLQQVENNKVIAEKEQAIIELLKTVEDLNAAVEALEESVKAQNEERHGLNKHQEELYKIREEKSEQLNLLDKDLLRIQNNKYKLETNREMAKEHIWNEYELTYNNALEYKDDDIGSLTAMRKNVNTLRHAIRELGSVNVNAIEEYKTVSERYEFLSTQRDDLIEAEEKLKDVIEDLRKRMENQFKEKFKEITVKFNDVFRELFGGGQGILRLTEDDDLLESGIEIVAQPPGKKLQSMMLLSGGEKAFTAIALLFAIQTLKPSPFCVLDEIEAALDDANVARFAKYLHKLSHQTQFIVITHRRGTMEAADTLYGITMQEKGVSTQVSVKLIENELEA